MASRSSTPAPEQATNLSAGNRGAMPGASSLNASSASTSPGGAVSGRCDPLVGREQRERGALLIDERGRVENENGHGRKGDERRRSAATLTLDTLFAPP